MTHPVTACRSSAAALVCGVALTFAATTFATPGARPSDRACLMAWNAPTNRENRVRLLALRPLSGLQLLPGVVGTWTWRHGTSTQTSSPACLLALAQHRDIRTVTGIWKAGGVSRWTFGRAFPKSRPFVANVRLLADGRVTKIYRR